MAVLKFYKFTFFFTLFLNVTLISSSSFSKEIFKENKVLYQKIWLRSKNNKVIVLDSTDKRSFKNIKIKGFRLKYPNRRRCSAPTLAVLKRDLELNNFLKTLVSRSIIHKKDFQFLKGYPFCKTYHFQFAVLSKVLNERYTIIKIKEGKKPLRKGFLAILFSRH